MAPEQQQLEVSSPLWGPTLLCPVTQRWMDPSAPALVPGTGRVGSAPARSRRTAAAPQNRPAVGLGQAIHALHTALAEGNVTNERPVLQQQAIGYRVNFTSNGIEATHIISHRLHDKVLIDVQTPEMDGLGSSRHITARHPRSHRLPIVAMTPTALQGDLEKLLDAGVNECVTKPLRVETLVRAPLGAPSRRRKRA